MNSEKLIRWLVIIVVAVVAIVLVLFAFRALAKEDKKSIWENKGEVEWSGYITPDATCGTSEGTELGNQEQQCKEYKGEGEGDDCEKGEKRTIEVSRSAEVQLVECDKVCTDETALNYDAEVGEGEVADNSVCEYKQPEPTPIVSQDKDDNDSDCDGVGKLLGFRTFPTHILKWTEKNGAKWVDIRAYNADGTFAYNLRTDDTGEFDLGGLGGKFFKARGVSTNGICPLGKWTKKLSF